MSLNWPKSGVNSVAEFQTSGHILPITGSGTKVRLKYVASSITLSADAADKDVTFYDGSHTGVVFRVPTDNTVRFKGKFLTLSIPAGAYALIELTNVPSGSYLPPSYSQMYDESSVS